MKTGLLAGAILLSVAFGSLHAFSVLTLPLQKAFGVSRVSVSFGYALAILALTAAVYGAPLVMRRIAPATMAIGCGVAAAAGLGFAGSGFGLGAFLAGYGVIFGFANGLAYSLFLDRAALALPQQKGFAIGLVTATYGGGAALFAPALDVMTDYFTVFTAVLVLALVVLLCGLVAALFFTGSKFITSDRRAARPAPRHWTRVMWALYFFGALGGLMTIGHTAPLFESRFPGTALASFAVMLVAMGNIAGSISGGLWAQRSSQRWALALPITLSGGAVAVLFVAENPVLALTALCTIGLAYGGLIAAIPVVVLGGAGPQGFTASFGRIFSAWGLAGLAGPSCAGLLFDHAGTYAAALLCAFIAALVSLMFVWLLPKGGTISGAA